MMQYLTAGTRILIVAVLAVALPADMPAQTENGATDAGGARGPLVVGVKDAAPFAMKRSDGSWSGISIELWKRISDRLNLKYELQETDLQGLLDGVASGRFDAAVAALTVTSDRERRFDFTHPFHTTGLSIAVRSTQKSGWLRVLERLFSRQFLQVLAALTVLLLGIGVLVWAVERKQNPENFGGTPIRGIGAGFYWSAVTMTTVGYGDKAATTFWGRLLTIVWMFVAVIIISSFTAAIASALTVGQLQSPVQGPDDLPKVRVGTVGGSTSEAYLRRERTGFSTFDTTEDGLMAVAQGRIDAMVYDAPILRYLVRTQFQDRLRVLSVSFERQDYAIALSSGNDLRESINRVLLDETRSQSWRDVLFDYLGGR